MGDQLICIETDTLKPRRTGCNYADYTSKFFLLIEILRIWMQYSLKFPRGPFDNDPTLV